MNDVHSAVTQNVVSGYFSTASSIAVIATLPHSGNLTGIYKVMSPHALFGNDLI
ncbi:hypothetical protein J6590_085242 [Homalodisca vitripennis]|nr:hypothetical protein J6590_085242 [Homalodisca vitripennis]